MRNKLAFYDSAGSMQAVMLSRYLYNVATTSRGVYAGFSSCRPRYCRISMCFLCFWGLWKIFSSEIPLFLFSGVFLKLFLYRPLPRIEKQVTLDFWYLRTNFFSYRPHAKKFASYTLEFALYAIRLPCFNRLIIYAKEVLLRSTNEFKKNSCGFSRN